jgi:hypothetical protein
MKNFLLFIFGLVGLVLLFVAFVEVTNLIYFSWVDFSEQNPVIIQNMKLTFGVVWLGGVGILSTWWYRVDDEMVSRASAIAFGGACTVLVLFKLVLPMMG